MPRRRLRMIRRTMAASKHLALYSGSFDPITLGHLDVLKRARGVFDEIVVAIGRNPEKEALFSIAERVAMAKSLVEELLRQEPGGAAVRVETYQGLTVDFAREIGATALLRGIRHASDLASECQLAITNRQVAGVETVFLVTGEAFAYTSSSLIKQIAALGGDLDRLASMVPPMVLDALRGKRRDPNNPLGRLARNAPEE
jgi:pantetheine-phosphate adenylyltransferase